MATGPKINGPLLPPSSSILKSCIFITFPIRCRSRLATTTLAATDCHVERDLRPETMAVVGCANEDARRAWGSEKRRLALVFIGAGNSSLTKYMLSGKAVGSRAVAVYPVGG
jgi:hypothetical protein